MIPNDAAALCRAEFSCHAPGASSVFLVASFTEDKAGSIPMVSSGSGEWSVTVHVPPGEHRYKYVVVYSGSVRLLDDTPQGAVHHLCAEGHSVLLDQRFWPVLRQTNRSGVGGAAGYRLPLD